MPKKKEIEEIVAAKEDVKSFLNIDSFCEDSSYIRDNLLKLSFKTWFIQIEKNDSLIKRSKKDWEIELEKFLKKEVK